MKTALPRVVIWDRKEQASHALAEVIRPLSRELRIVESHADLLDTLFPDSSTDLLVADLPTILTLPESEIDRLRPPVCTVPVVIATDLRPEDYISDVRRLRLHHVVVKTDPFDRHELAIILDSAIDPMRGFGLVLHFDQTMEMFSVTARTRESKNEAVERVINYFATNGFEIHELYDVRLILEELINNAFYHAFRTPDGAEKYHLGSFSSLAPTELVRIDFGNAGNVVGFAVTDNAGTLEPDVVLEKMERQYKKHGLFDESGRGLYISRMLATTLFFNIQHGHRTQVVAIFRERDRKQRLKPLIINYCEPSAPTPVPGHGAALENAGSPAPAAESDSFSTRDIHEDLD